jgi:beta-glucosidase
MAQDFADYATAVVSQLGDRITHWITLNEISCFTHMGYGYNAIPYHAPGTQVANPTAVWQTSHHALLAHGLGCQAIRAASPVPCSVALVDNFAVPVPLTETERDLAAAKAAFPNCGFNAGIIIPALTGCYAQHDPAHLPIIQEGDLATIHQPLDCLGINVYSGVCVRAIDRQPGYEVLPFPPSYPKLHMPWLYFLPDSLYWAVRHISETLEHPTLPVLITENGCATDDQWSGREIVDSDRILYLRHHLRAAQRAIAEGYPLQGYFAWSWLDNFEWAWGYDRRFGLVYVDYATQQRIPKASAHWYSECIRQQRVV